VAVSVNFSSADQRRRRCTDVITSTHIRPAGNLLTTYIHVSVELLYTVTVALQNFTKKGLV
jgi:hypothetical protein